MNASSSAGCLPSSSFLSASSRSGAATMARYVATSAGDSGAGDAASFGAATEAAAAGPVATLVAAGAGAAAAGDSGGALFPPQAMNVNKPRHAQSDPRPFMRTNVSSRARQMASPRRLLQSLEEQITIVGSR